MIDPRRVIISFVKLSLRYEDKVIVDEFINGLVFETMEESISKVIKSTFELYLTDKISNEVLISQTLE